MLPVPWAFFAEFMHHIKQALEFWKEVFIHAANIMKAVEVTAPLSGRLAKRLWAGISNPYENCLRSRYFAPVITLDNIGLEYGGRWLFHDTTLQIKEGDRIGLIGRNGTGKTTLLKILTGKIRPSEGNVSMMRGLKIGSLDQEMQSRNTGETVMEVAMLAFEDQLRLMKEVDALLADPELGNSEALLEQLMDKQMQLESMDGYNLEPKAAAILAGLGFSDEDLQRPFDEFSGGWRMRVVLAQLLLREPDLLLLDEPTNHLDLPSIRWLEEYLRSFKGAFIIVSHDRDFLDRLITSTVELAHQEFTRYKGNYSFYLTEREVRRDQRQREFDNQQKMIEDTEKFITRFRAKATKARQVQSKVKLLDKVDKIEAPESEAAVVNFAFKSEITPGKEILNLDIIDKSYGTRRIVKDSKLTIMRGDKIALIGANGLGKSTVLRVIAGQEPFEGESKIGHNVKTGFFAQHQLDALTPENDITQEMSKFIYQKGEAYVRSILGGFLFTGDDVFKKIKVLSGGEKSRVALAKTLLSQANYLMLDEPTNHLDIQSIQILSQALQQYDGTFIVVSHDRFFLRAIANKIWYIEDQELKEYPGNYEAFEYHMNQRAAAKKEAASQAAKEASAAKQQQAKAAEAAKPDFQQNREKQKRARKLKGDIERVENEITKLEEKKKGLIESMGSPEMAAKFSELERLQKEATAIDKQVLPLQNEWERLLQEADDEGIEL